MANNDQIYEAYVGNMGEKFQKQTHTRINWILEQVQGRKDVLDIGCSQGIVSILCAEQGAKVTGIEVQCENVEFANKLLQEKYSHLSEQVEFVNEDFMQWNNEKAYDAIVLTEVIEHLPDCEAFLKHAAKYLKDNGIIVITTPFGYCNHPDHVHTFYLSSFFQIVSAAFTVSEIQYGGKWFGCVATLKVSENKELSCQDFEKEEEQFLIIHKELSEQVSTLYDNLQDANKKYKDACDSIQRLKEWRENDINKLTVQQEENEKYLTKIEEQRERINQYETEISKQIQNYNTEQNTFKEQLEGSAELLIECVAINGEYIKLMTSAKRTIQKQQREIMLLRQEVDLQQKRWERLENIWVFKIALNIYRKIRHRKSN